MRPTRVMLAVLLLAGCGNDPGTGPDLDPAVPQPEAAEPVRDAIARIVPALDGTPEAASIGAALARLAQALERGEAAESEAAAGEASRAIEDYASGAGADQAEVEAVRLAVEQAAR